MTSIDDKGRFKQVIKCLSLSIQKKLIPLTEQLCGNAQEIRLRINRPLTVVCPDITYYVTQNSGLTSTPIDGSMFIVTRADIADTFQNICNYSVYTRQNEISNGYITMHGGHRAGICGTAVINGGKITNIRDISSVNVRIAKEHRECARTLINKLGSFDKGVLICGAPCSGKTTVLRDMARILSTDLCKNVSLIDERGELAGTSAGVFQNDIGMCDVFDSYIKSEAMLQAIRSMAPDILICDEIGSEDDISAIEHSVNCGVSVVATVHSANEFELRKKENIKRLAATRAFSKAVFLSGKKYPGEIVKISEIGDVFGT